jgi:hypothetical protein
MTAEPLCPRCGFKLLYRVTDSKDSIGCLFCGFMFKEQEIITT